jgi:menaquinol-cytochrome c reductase cytochrome b subunit
VTDATQINATQQDGPSGRPSLPETSLFARGVPLHARRFWFCFGGLTFFTAVILAISGAFLALYYEPTPDRAYASIFYITNYVRYGWLIRSVHFWSAQLMVVFILIHMIRVFVTASYKHPRELNWVVGVGLLVVTLSFALTGYLLPWDQKAYWGSTAAVALTRQIPIVGESLALMVAGGGTLGAAALSRFYSAHIMALPAALAVMLLAHFWMVRKQGISGPL